MYPVGGHWGQNFGRVMHLVELPQHFDLMLQVMGDPNGQINRQKYRQGIKRCSHQ